MLDLGPSKECEMVLAFLQAEAEADRYAEIVEQGVLATGFTRGELIEQPDLGDLRQNQARLWILGAYRGYRQNRLLFLNFPSDAAWRRIELEPSELDKLKYANEASWVQMSDGTRKPSRLVEKLKSGQLPNELTARIRAIQLRYEEGLTFPDLIAAEAADSSFILIEGHSRASAYAASHLKNGIRMFLATSPSMPSWFFY